MCELRLCLYQMIRAAASETRNNASEITQALALIGDTEKQESLSSPLTNMTLMETKDKNEVFRCQLCGPKTKCRYELKSRLMK